MDGALLYLWPWLDRELPAGVPMPFDHEAAIRRYETDWRALSAAFYSKDAQVLREARLARLAAFFRDPHLPEPFRRLPPREVADFNCLTFSPYGPSQVFVADKDAACGVAALYSGSTKRSKGVGFGYHREIDTPSFADAAADAHAKPLAFGVSDGPTVALRPDEIPPDGRYHVHRIGRITVKKGTTVWAVEGRRLGVTVDRLFVDGAKDPGANEWDAYVSLKVTGPAYVKGASDPNGVWLDRALLVKPRSEDSAGSAPTAGR